MNQLPDKLRWQPNSVTKINTIKNLLFKLIIFLFQDLKKFFDEADHGVIYISFGSIVKASTMPADKVQEVLKVMKQLPQRFIWKWEDKTLLVDKNKLYTNSWLPQVDILGKHLNYTIIYLLQFMKYKYINVFNMAYAETILSF